MGMGFLWGIDGKLLSDGVREKFLRSLVDLSEGHGTREKVGPATLNG